jgi:hypothetical protein
MKFVGMLMLAAVALITGCASSGHCLGEFDYQKAYSLPQPAVPGLRQPPPSAALVIPAPGKQIVPYAYSAPDPSKPGQSATQCLDTPPRMPAIPSAAPAPVLSKS